MPPAHAAKRTLNRSYSGIDSYRAASCVPVNGGTSHDLGSGSGGIGRVNGFDASNGIPVPNLSEHARFMMAFSLWHMRGNTHSPSACSPKYHLEITSGVICLSVMPPNTSFKWPTSVRRLRLAAPRSAVPSGFRCVSTYQSASSSNVIDPAFFRRSLSVGCTHCFKPRRCISTSSCSPASHDSASRTLSNDRCTRRPSTGDE